MPQQMADEWLADWFDSCAHYIDHQRRLLKRARATGCPAIVAMEAQLDQLDSAMRDARQHTEHLDEQDDQGWYPPGDGLAPRS